ncbi:hypothetical protein SAMN05421787_102107 [Virgibacillus pantothenticus]|uniref:Uncharacterized protein n=1 Tax=Virgibacillus pantothenticus TaxID=1473 RepID=A0A0L0QRR7_VIRPA|nr:hypothetical protein AFK71_06000 [Virgibacillus pantothenticus]SIS68502.1 hypothetical protein SAMN05421787_102107 [Virgibacillus pantothenticus]
MVINRLLLNLQIELTLYAEKDCQPDIQKLTVGVNSEIHMYALQKMHEKPEIYRDPLILFELS